MSTLVSATWKLRMREPHRHPVTVRSTFVLRREPGSWRIVLYSNHEDLGDLLSGIATHSA